jgi:hypothetical protein
MSVAEYDEEQNTKSSSVMGASLLISGAIILSKPRPKVEQTMTAIARSLCLPQSLRAI